MPAPQAFARLTPQEPPDGDFSLEDLVIHAIGGCCQLQVAVLRTRESGPQSARHVAERLSRGEQRRAGATIVRVDDMQPGSRLRLSESWWCSHRTCLQHERALRSGGARSPGIAGSTAGLTSPRKRARGTAADQRSAQRSQAAAMGGEGAACGCGFHIQLRMWTYELFLLLDCPEHADRTGRDAHVTRLSAECCNEVRDGHARGLQTESILRGASVGTHLVVRCCIEWRVWWAALRSLLPGCKMALDACLPRHW